MGCEKPPQLVVAGVERGETAVLAVKAGETTFEFYRHPELFITPSTTIWLKEYRGIKDGTYTAIPFTERHSAWCECKEVYESYLEGFKRGNRNS